MQADRRRGRAAFTLIEIVVVLAVIVLLVALLLPAVMGARESARRVRCLNNLKQIGVALGNHATQHGRFPSGIDPDRPDGRPGRHSSMVLSPQVRLLPFLEQTTLFNSLNLEVPQRVTDIPSNATAISTVVEVFLCPSDPVRTGPGNSYRACVGTKPHEMDSEDPPGGGGAFPGLHETTPAEFTDGLSQTAGFSERLRGRDRDRFDPRRDIWFSGIGAVAPPRDGDEMIAACERLRPPPADFWSRSGSQWCVGRYADTLYNHVAPPNWAHSDCNVNTPFGRPGDMSGGAITARSWHPSGIHVLLMDGSTRFAREGIDLAIWRALATRAGSEPITGFP